MALVHKNNGNSDGRMRVILRPVDGSGSAGGLTPTPLRRRGGLSVLDDFSSRDAGPSSVQSATRVVADAMDVVAANDGWGGYTTQNGSSHRTLDFEEDEDMGVNKENEFQSAGFTAFLPVPVNSGTRERAVLQEITVPQFDEHDYSDIEFDSEEEEDSEEPVNHAYQLEERIRQNKGPPEMVATWVASMGGREMGGFYDFEIYMDP